MGIQASCTVFILVCGSIMHHAPSTRPNSDNGSSGTLACRQFKAQIKAGSGDRFSLERLDQQLRCLVTNLVTWRDDRGDRRRGTCGPGKVIETDNRHLLRYFDITALTFDHDSRDQS